jgi:hypothetical protein
MEVVGNMEDEKYFFILAFMKSKDYNRLITHLLFIVHMFA